MTKVRFEEMFPWEVAQAMEQAPICYLPLGVLEWHGEHNAVGLDAIKAHALCVDAAEISGGMVVPPLYWGSDFREDLSDGSYLTGGIERGERYHVPGSMFWIRRETFHNLLLDIYEAMQRRGFRVIMVISGHWSPDVFLPTVRSSAWGRVSAGLREPSIDGGVGAVEHGRAPRAPWLARCHSSKPATRPPEPALPARSAPDVATRPRPGPWRWHRPWRPNGHRREHLIRCEHRQRGGTRPVAPEPLVQRPGGLGRETDYPRIIHCAFVRGLIGGRHATYTHLSQTTDF